MDPNAALWVLGSIAGAFIALLGIIFIAISFLISKAEREYELTKRMVTEFEREVVKEFGEDALSFLGKGFSEETAKKSVKNLLLGVRPGRIFFPGSIVLIAYCLLFMSFVKMGVEFPLMIVGIAVAGAVGLLGSLYSYMNWCLGAALDLELRWVSREEKYRGLIASFKPIIQYLKSKKKSGKD